MSKPARFRGIAGMSIEMKRRDFLRLMAGGAAAAIMADSASADALPPLKTLIYKKCEIKADVYAAADGTRNPAVMWVHGGALIQGSRKWIDGPFLGELRKRGFAVVSIDYRLAPETKLPAIIEDVQDAWKWLRTHGSQQFGIDPDRIAVAGGFRRRLSHAHVRLLPRPAPACPGFLLRLRRHRHGLAQ